MGLCMTSFVREIELIKNCSSFHERHNNEKTRSDEMKGQSTSQADVDAINFAAANIN